MIGYYIHHCGSGHAARAGAVARACAEPMVALSSLPAPADHPFVDWVQLAPDPPVDAADDPTAGGALHWAPLNSPGYGDRMRTLARWVAAAHPRLVHVDVSAEVAALVRLLGVPVGVTAMPGTRDDAAHVLAYRLATVIVAPWFVNTYDAAPLAAYADKVVHTGALSRFDGRPQDAVRPGRVLVLLGTGGGAAPAGLAGALTAAGWDGRTLGGGQGWIDDPWAALCAAEVVVTHAGQNALAEVAAAGRPAIVIPQHRPFDEQGATGRALTRAGLAQVLPDWPADRQWPDLLERARRPPPASWRAWNDGAGAARFADALTAAAP